MPGVSAAHGRLKSNLEHVDRTQQYPLMVDSRARSTRLNSERKSYLGRSLRERDDKAEESLKKG